LIAFTKAGPNNPDALVVNYLGITFRRVAIRVAGTSAQSFDAFISDPASRQYFEAIGTRSLRNGTLEFALPAQSVVTFFAK
jgi:hypothetical protein